MENAFALPTPLFSCKRKTPPASLRERQKQEAVPFLCEQTYEAYSVDGHAREAGVFRDELAKRTAIRAALATQNGSATSAKTNETKTSAVSAVTCIQPVATVVHVAVAAPSVAKPTKHLTAILLERALREHSREIVQIQNVARRLTSIAVADQVEYVRLHQKRAAAAAGGIPDVLALTPDEYKTLKRLEIVAKREQVEFELDLERLVKKERLSEYTFVPPFVEMLYDQLAQNCREQVMHLYWRYYDPQMDIVLHGSSASTSEREASTMKHIKEVAADGRPPLVDEAALVPGANLDPEESGFVVEDENFRQATTAWRAISADPTAERLMEQHNCDVAMSSSTLLAIFDTAADECNFDSLGWMIPVKSRVCLVNGRPRRQLYLDRPVLNEHVSAREKIESMAREIAIRKITKATENTSGRVSYHVWQLGDLKILIRTTVQAFAVESSSKATKPASVFIKPDHKPLGIEERITPSEFRRMWLHSWIRGGSAVILARLSPKTSTVASWSKFALSTLMKSLGSPGFPDAFDPLDYFVVLNKVLTSLTSLPAANYLLKCPLRLGVQNTERRVQVFRAGADVGLVDDRSHQFDLFQLINMSGKTSLEATGYVLPAWPVAPDRIPYTYRTGSYCLEHLQHNVCSREGEGEACEHEHLRLLFTKDKISWLFEDAATSQAAKRASSRPNGAQPRALPKLTPSFPFCRGNPSTKGGKLVANPYATILCDKPNECGLPHLSLHGILQRVADHALRTAREKRRMHKTTSRARKRGFAGGDDDRWHDRPSPHSEGFQR